MANSNLSYSRYWRLVALASVDFCFTIPMSTWGIVLDSRFFEVGPWVSWDNYFHISQYPRAVLDENPVGVIGLAVTQWGTVFCAFVFFGFFGFADEAMENYRLLISTVAERLGRRKVSSSSPPDQLSAMNFSGDEVPQIPESVLDPTSVRRPSVTDAPKSIHLDNALDQV
jgi:pheromone a factor receptor